MSHSRREALVILHRDETGSIADVVEPHATVSQSISDRVAVVTVAAADVAELESLSAVERVVAGSSPDPAALPELDETETLFTNAWLSRRGEKEKTRPGEDLDWDSPGFAPPDSPSGED